MKLNKQEEADLLQVYNTWWDSYLNGDVETYDSFLADDFRFVGSTNNEEFLNRIDTTNFFKATADQLSGKAELRNTIRNIEILANGLILITDVADAYVIGEPEWVFYSRFRFTSMLRKDKNGWRFIYQHFSAPDSKAEEGETLGLEKISKENQELRDAIKRRTVELEQKNRDLEIEASLERVRARSMAMHKSDEIMEVIQIIFQELSKLGFDVMECSIVTYDANPKDLIYWSSGSYASDEPSRIKLQYIDHPILVDLFKDLGNGVQYRSEEFSGELLRSWWNRLFTETDFKNVSKEVIESWKKIKQVFYAQAAMNHGFLEFVGGSPLPEEKVEILKRFTKVVDLTYTRFDDVKKAEAQAREAQIEAALEKVRSKTIGMQRSDELQDAAMLLFQQVEALGVHAFGCGFNIWDEDRKFATAWMAGEDRLQPPFKTSSSDDIFLRIYDAAERKESLFVEEQAGEELERHYRYMATIPVFKDVMNQIADASLSVPSVQVMHCAFFSQGYLMFITYKPVAAAHDIFKRFATVFQQTYTRFLDLQKAEAQAREAQIEAALERARTQSMMMQYSSELNLTTGVFHEQLQFLGIDSEFSYLWLPDEDKMEHLFWATWQEDQKKSSVLKNKQVVYPLDKSDPAIAECYVVWDSGAPVHVNPVQPADVEDYFATWYELLDGVNKFKPELYPDGLYYVDAYMKYGCFGIMIRTPLSESEQVILQRFSKEFERAYTRFLALQKAEAQAREAQIEAALEIIRSRSLAMHTTNELGDVVAVIVEKLSDLGVVLDANGVVLCTYFQESKDVLHWMASPDFTIAGSYLLPYFDHPIFKDAWQSKESGIEYFSKAYSVKEKDSFFEYAFEHSDYKYFPDDFKQWIFQNDKHILSFAWQKNSAILIPSHTGVLPTDDDKAILIRFAKVFEQAYVRFMDLQKAEVQAREAQIEAALERVRSKAMAMHSSEDLGLTVDSFFSELIGLNVSPHRCGVGIVNGETRMVKIQAIDTNQNQDTKKIVGDLKLAGHPVLDKVFESWEFQKEYFPVLRGQEITDYYEVMNPQVAFHEFADDEVQYGYYFYFKEGGVYAWTDIQLQEQDIQIFRRYTSVLSLTYRRYLDLKDAEEQAQKAKIETALERVRARALAMQQPEELKDVADVLRNEMGKLGIEELETCSIYINDASAEKAECWYAIKDVREEKKILVNDYFALSLNDTWVGREMLKFYNSKEPQVSILMTGKPRIEWIRYCEEKSVPFRGYYGDVIPDRTYHLYKFSHGAIGVATPGDISDENWGLLKRAASVFSLAYSRFKDLTQARIDLQRLKEEKKRAEHALANLEATQEQLVHAEKMASLGELTAGIAHEIQNPLNFVNNFSEVNSELIEELKEEIDNGELEEAKAIADDIAGNEKKIKHHGKRADDIVKGMLQHSRTTAGEKEPTDINELADEFLRLAYHGLRAKDKSFNADFKTELDKNLSKIKVIPQDIGRVLLNLINNAFHAVSAVRLAKGTAEEDIYKPIVIVSTKKLIDKIEIRVKDNGMGIPKDIRDKVFQPFFTTKPTGEGTGLGLSLSYDIITKGHGGELKVETKEGKGSEFIIHLPV